MISYSFFPPQNKLRDPSKMPEEQTFSPETNSNFCRNSSRGGHSSGYKRGKNGSNSNLNKRNRYDETEYNKSNNPWNVSGNFGSHW